MAFATRTHPVLYLLRTRFPRPYLNMFRGEPAISELDWPFTPTLKSSERFSTHNGSVLHRLLRRLDRKSTRLNSSHSQNSYAVFCLKKKKKKKKNRQTETDSQKHDT